MGYLLTGKEPTALQQEPGVLRSKDSSLGEPFKVNQIRANTEDWK